MNRRPIFIGSALTLFFVAGLVWIAGGILTSPAQVDIGNAPAGAEVVSFDSRSGSRVHGWYFPHAEPIGTAVLMHGVRGNRTDMLGRVPFFSELGFSVLTFDFQAHGESRGAAITFGAVESLDVLAALDFARSRINDLPIIVDGVSLGGAAALLAGSELEASALILESVYSTIEQATRNRLNMRIPGSGVLAPVLTWQLGPRLGLTPRELSPLNAASSTSRPVLVLSGAEDLHTELWETQALFDALAGPKKLHLFDGAAHQNLHAFNPNEYQQTVVSFLCEKAVILECDTE